MDELLHHCIRELAFEGDLGCDVSRLRDFITDFYEHTGSAQNVDDAYCGFVWSVVAQQPEVRIGLAPPGAQEVYIAPQAIKNVGAKSGAVGSLEIIPDAESRPLNELRAQYGDSLRIAVDPERSFVAITGSHIRPSKLTPTVYTCLQLVSRGRERGISAVDLSKKTGYDAKTVHYLVEKLVSLNLVVKRKKAGVGANFCIHKYFFERSQAWQDVLAEEEEAMQQIPHDGDEEGPSASTSLHFDPIDSRHLSSLQLVQARIEKLLRVSPHQTHSLKNLITKIGFAHPSKMDRNFFLTRVRELEANGVLERIEVPREKGKPVTCIRLLAQTKQEEQSSMGQDDPTQELEVELSAPKASVGFHRQLIDLMHDNGTDGATLGDISKALGDFDRRIIDHQLNRLKEIPAPAHLRDLEIAQISETFGRERRYKYFSAIHYRKVAARENLESPYAEGYFDHVGGFGTTEASMFFSTSEEFNKFVDNFKAAKDEAAGKKVEKKPIGRPRKRKREDDILEGGESSAPPKKKRAGKKAVPAPPPLESGLVTDSGEPPAPAPIPTPKKRGRPPKNKAPIDPDAPPPPPKQKRQPKAKADSKEPKIPKKRGRPPKAKPLPEDTLAVETAPVEAGTVADPVVSDDEANVLHLLSPSPQIDGEISLRGPILPVVDKLSYPELPEEPSPSRSHAPPATAMSAGHTVVEPAAGAEPSSPRSQQGNASLTTIPSSLIDPVLLELDDIAAPPQSPPPPTTTAQSNIVHSLSLASEPASLDGLISFDDDEPLTSKRPPSPGSSTLPQAKRVKMDIPTSAGGRTNISKVRRRKELLQVITNLGGIANLSSKEFHEAHTALIEALTEAGEAASSSVGSKIDKRTVNATLNELESQGLVKVKVTILTSPTGSNKQIKIAHLVETPEEDVQRFLQELSLIHSTPQPPAVRLLEEPIEYGGGRQQRATRQRVSAQPAAQAREEHPEEIPQPVQSEDDITRSVMLGEAYTIIQQYGFIVGKIARAKALHLHILDVFDQSVSPDIVSAKPRILHLPHFFQNIPVGIYRLIVSIRTHSDELLRLLSTPEGRNTPVGSLRQDIIDLCEMNRSRSRTKMLELLETLQSLDLLVPLRETESNDPLVRCEPNGNHPTAFEEAPLDPIATASAPQYWLFNPTAPIHMWALDDTDPPLYDTLPVHSVADGERFWQELNRASLDGKHCKSVMGSRTTNSSSEHTEADVDPLTVKLLRRETQWRTSYNFCYKQKAYLRQFTTPSDGSTPLQDPDHGAARLEHIAHIACAPVAEVSQFYEHERAKMLRDLKRLEKKRMFVRTNEEDKATLAQKAAEAKAQRKRDWEDMVVRVHPAPLKSHEQSRVRAIRHRFLQSSGTDMQKWEREIQDAIREAMIPAKPSTFTRLGAQVLPSLPVNTNEKSIEELIANQIPRPPVPARLSKKEKEKAKQEAPSTSAIIRRRTRFNWTPEYEELARDASAIIRARCRDGKRLDWSAIEVLFPGVPRNTVRQRIGHLREFPGADIYLKRLEDRWYELWQRHLDTPELPDEDPGSATNFDIVAHIKFLRSHVDKNALRVGFAEATEQPLTATLPNSVESIAKLWDVVEKPRAEPSFDYLWNTAAEEGREKLFARDPFVLGGNELPPDLNQYAYEKLYTADAALKMAFATPGDAYDADGASQLLKSVGDEVVQTAVQIMSDKSAISMTVRDPRKTKPGRTFKISDNIQNLLIGPFPSEIYQQAELFEDALAQNDDKEWGEWPLLSSDGDAVALLELVSENKVEMKVDLTHFQAVRAAVDWNSKKADDDHIETAVFVRMKEPTGVPTATAADVTMHDDDADAAAGAQTGPHGTNADGKAASCALSTSGPVDCAACLESALVDLRASLEPDDAVVLDSLVQQLDDAGPPGLTRKQLETICSRELGKLSALIGRLIGASPPIAFWTGYNEVVLVSSQYVDEWSVVLAQDDTSCARAFPRRWLDIHGRRMNDIWHAACRAAVGTVLLHPAVSQGELRWRLRLVYNRQELEDVLRHLLREGYLKRTVRSEDWCEGPPGNAEEGAVFWTVGRNRVWYQV